MGFFFFLISLFFVLIFFKNNDSDVFLVIKDRKSEFYLTLIDQKKLIPFLSDQKKISQELNILSQNKKTLFKENKIVPCRLNFYITSKKKEFFIEENTNANYQHAHPEIALTKPLDFDILIASNFGLSAFLIDKRGIIKNTFRENQPYYSVASTKDFLLLGGSYGWLDVISKRIQWLGYRIEKYSVPAIFSKDDQIFCIASKFSDLDHHAIYTLNPFLGVLTPLSPPIFGDVRGGCVDQGLLYLAEGDKNRIVVWDIENKKMIKSIKGFNYPNDITITPRKTFLVANEHNNEVLEIDFSNQKIIRFSPIQELRSPGSVLEIDRGIFKGFWLISDTDNDRVILVHPDTWDIIFECRDLNSPMSAVPIWDN